MPTTYPSSKQTFTDPSGTSPLASGPDHAALHTSINDTVEALQDTLGTTQGTNIAKNFNAGDLAVRANSSNVLQQTLQGTINNSVIGTPTITGGTANNQTIGTPTLVLGSDAQGDLLYRSSGGTITRLGIGAGSQVLTTNGTTPSWGSVQTVAVTDAAITSRKMKLDQIQALTSTTNLNTSSTSYVDYTGLSATFTPNVASNFLVLVSCTFNVDAQGVVSLITDLDGSTSGNDPLISSKVDNGGFAVTISGFLWITGVSSASHTIKVKIKVSTGTLTTTYGSLTVIPFAS